MLWVGEWPHNRVLWIEQERGDLVNEEPEMFELVCADSLVPLDDSVLQSPVSVFLSVTWIDYWKSLAMEYENCDMWLCYIIRIFNSSCERKSWCFQRSICACPGDIIVSHDPPQGPMEN